jgi:hypothetical protein
MNDFEIMTDGWQAMGDFDDPAIAATFTFLKIRANGQDITYVEEKRNQSTANHILVPLYPLAEWIVAHWWFLTEENYVPNRKDYWERHSMARGREGFAFPDLRLIPEGTTCRLEWHRWHTRHMSLNFLAEGEAHVPMDAMRETLRDLIIKVIERLNSCGIVGSWLEKEWDVIENTRSEELQFCRAAAWVGLDPYEINDAQAFRLIKASEQLPATLREETLRAAAPEALAKTVDWVAAGTQALPGTALNGVLGKLRKPGANYSLQHSPWNEGYQLARQFRNDMNALNFDFDDLEPDIIPSSPQVKGIEGISGITQDRRLGCFTASKVPHNQRFTWARGLLDWVYGNPDGPVVLTKATTQPQQRNRAFAAELLAPAALIQKKLVGTEVDSIQLEELGSEFNVSDWVIRYQIKNHRLAELVD